MPSVDAVLFDLDDTLCEYRRSGAELLALAFEDVSVEPFFDVRDYHARYDEFLGGAETVRDLRAACFAALARERGRDPELGRAVADAYAAERDHRNVRPLAGAHDAVEGLARGHRLGIVTNGSPDMQRRKLAALDFADAFESVVHAGHDAPAKPDPAPFHHALADLDASPGRAVHVGNSLTTDVPGARAAGLRAAWLADGDDIDADFDPRPDYRLDSLRDLLEPPWR